ncbi:hypothetical protein [Aurantibacillus circumpalustris]|uniref:hypothetical protein n=1 Tax=Aurantibacillus circumpalustris TaxID=3036359 RepID=UPI00295B8B61|nr:hypothetical protein [Aurantibacillus circumpalustris]
MTHMLATKTKSLNLKYTKVFLLALVLLCANTSYSQIYLAGTETESYPDSIKFLKLPVIKKYSLENYQGDYLDSLTEPKGSILKVSFLNPNPGIYFVQKVKDYFLLYKIMADTPDRLKFKRMDFNGKGKNELLIDYERGDGRFHSADKNGLEGGFASYEKGFLILDLDSMNILAHFDHYFSQQNWVGKEKGDAVCHNFIPEITKGEICFKQSNICNSNKEDIKLKIETPAKICYKVSESSLMFNRNTSK